MRLVIHRFADAIHGPQRTAAGSPCSPRHLGRCKPGSCGCAASSSP